MLAVVSSAHVCLCMGKYTCVHVSRGQATSIDLFQEKEKTDTGWRETKESKAGKFQLKKFERKQP